MTDNPDREPAAQPDLEQTVRQLEARLDRLERYLGFQSSAAASVAGGETPAAESAVLPGTTLEHRIGEFWLARVGILALLLGLFLLLVYPFATLPALVPCLIGYLAAGGLFLLARAWAVSYRHLSRTLFGGALVLLYFSTLRLHFFSRHPLIDSEVLALGLLVVVLAVHLVLAARVRSQFMAGLAAMLACATALISQTTHFAGGLLLVTCLAAVELLRRYNWQGLTNVTLVLVYATHLQWLLNNPLMTRAPALVETPPGNHFYLLGYAAVFVAANAFHFQTDATRVARILRTIFNAAGLVVLGNLEGYRFWPNHLAIVNLVLHLFFMVAATGYWLHRESRYSTSIYACFGYLALSAAIFAHFRSPSFFIWLTWQSLLVASTAVWFRSKIIVVVNVLIYLGIYLVYLGTTSANGWVNLGLAVVALVAARILNWQKSRLELRTELFRNIYLGAAAVIVPYGLYHAVPSQWVSVSWLGAALVFFALSIAMRNIKYRWIAIATILAAAGHALVVDLARQQPAFRIVSFLAVGVVLLVVSLLYARHRSAGRQKN